MANYVTNRLTLDAEPERIQEILTAIAYEDKGIGTIDFEKIIPMPGDVYRGALGLKEKELYGKNTWYDWRIEHWGTKWNSRNCECYPYEGGTEIIFDTAWSCPEPVIRHLSEMYPDARSRHAWADEDIGQNVGEALYSNGETVEWDIPIDGSKEAYEMAADILGCKLSEHGLFYDGKIGNYEYREEYDSPDQTESETQGMGGICRL
jgi:hypothetical protein